MASVYGLALLAMILTLTITPDLGEYAKGMRRAGREGLRRPSPWSDAGSSRIALFSLCALVLVGALTVASVVGRPAFYDPAKLGWQGWSAQPNYIDPTKFNDDSWRSSRQSMMSRPIAIAVMTVAYVGLALQFFSLRTRQSGLTLTALFIFLAWLVPIVAGAIIATGGPGTQSRSLQVLALSPVAGISLASGLAKPDGTDRIQLVALFPPITFAFIFNYLLVITQRKTDRDLIAQRKDPQPIEPEFPGIAASRDSTSEPQT